MRAPAAGGGAGGGALGRGGAGPQELEGPRLGRDRCARQSAWDRGRAGAGAEKRPLVAR